METQGSVQVVVRLRPLNRREKRDGTLPVVTTNTERGQVTLIKGSGIKAAKHRFTFGNVYGSFCTQEEIFDSTLKPIITDVCSGIESTVFAYGQTGTGKTFTMEGVIDDTELRGLIPRASSGIFEFLSDERFIEKSVSVSYLEIYNEELSDLLTPADEAVKKLSIVASGSGKEQKVYCRNLSKHKVSSVDEILQALRNAQEKRKTAETKMNKASSRSHCLFTLSVHSVEKVDEGTIERNGKLHLVDLAGSECAKNIDQSRMRESSNINQSLLTLGRVITALKEKQPRVPYRDCKLTRILQEALGGRSKTCIIATLSPSILCAEETHSTLNFAERAHGLINKTIKSDVKMTMQTPNTPKKDVVRAGNAAETSESFRDMEIRLKYMEAQCEEAQTALARKHLIAKNAAVRAEKLEKEIGGMQKKLESAQANLEVAKTREEQMKANLDKKIIALREMGKNLVKSQSSERRLHAEATGLQENLRSTTAYSKDLHSQLSNQLSQETAQKKATLKLMSKLKSISEDSSDNSRKHQQFLQSSAREVLQLLGDNLVQTEQQTTRLEAEIGSQCSNLEETNQRMSSTLNRTLSEVDSLDSELREMQTKREEQLANGCSSMSTKMNSKMKELVSCVEEYESRLTQWSDTRRDSLEKKIEAFNDSAGAHSKALEKAAATGNDGILNFLGDLKKHIRSIEHLSQHANHQLYLVSRHEDTLANVGEALLKRLQNHTATMVEHIGNVENVVAATRNLNDVELNAHTTKMLKQAEEFIVKEKKEFLERLDELKQISANVQAGNLGEYLMESTKKFDEDRNTNHQARAGAFSKLSEDLTSTKENLQANCLETRQVERLAVFEESHRGQTEEQSALVSKHRAHIQTLLAEHRKTETQEKEHLSSVKGTAAVVSFEVEAGVQMVEEQRKTIEAALAKHKELQESMFAGVMASLEHTLKGQMAQLRERMVEDMSALSTKADDIEKHKRSLEATLVSNLDTLETETKDWGALNSKTSEKLVETLSINESVDHAVKAGSESTQLSISEVKNMAELWGANNRKTMGLIAESNAFVGSIKDSAEQSFAAETECSATLKDSIASWQTNNAEAVGSLEAVSEGFIQLQTGIVQSHNELSEAGEVGLKQIGTLSEKKAGLISASSDLLTNAKSHHGGLGETTTEVESSNAQTLVQSNQMTSEIQSMQTSLSQLRAECDATMDSSESFKANHEVDATGCSKSFASLTQAQSSSLNEEISMVEQMIGPQTDYLEQVDAHSQAMSKSIEVYQSDMKQESVSSATSQAHVQNQAKSKLMQLDTANQKSSKELTDTSSSIGSLTKAYKKSFDELQQQLSESHEKWVNGFVSESKDVCIKQAAVVESCSEMTGNHCEETLLVNKETMQLSAHRSFETVQTISSPTKAVIPRAESDEEAMDSENTTPNVEKSSKKCRKSFAGTPNKKIGTKQRRNSDTKPSKLREAQKPSFLRKPSKLKAPGHKA